MPSEPARIAASSLRMSPNMLPARITSYSAGERINCIAKASTRWWVTSTSGQALATSVTETPPQPHRGEHVRLVDRRDLAAAPLRRAQRDAGDPLDLGRRVDQRVVRHVAVALLLPGAEVDSAGQFAHEQEIDSAQQFRA